MGMHRKGISPLVATVLLVSITMAAAIIIASWANIFLGQKRGEFEEFAEQEQECRFGNMRFLEDLEYSSSDRKLTAIVENTGRVTLSGFTFQVLYSDNSRGNVTTTIGTLTPGDFKSISVTVPGSSAPQFIRLTTNCQDVYLEKNIV